MTIELMNYLGKKVVFEVGNLEDIARIVIDVKAGDEVMTVYYKDYTDREFDSSDCRRFDFNDGHYILYDFRTPYDSLLDVPEFINRKDSYWFRRL